MESKLLWFLLWGHPVKSRLATTPSCSGQVRLKSIDHIKWLCILHDMNLSCEDFIILLLIAAFLWICIIIFPQIYQPSLWRVVPAHPLGSIPQRGRLKVFLISSQMRLLAFFESGDRSRLANVVYFGVTTFFWADRFLYELWIQFDLFPLLQYWLFQEGGYLLEFLSLVEKELILQLLFFLL